MSTYVSDAHCHRQLTYVASIASAGLSCQPLENCARITTSAASRASRWSVGRGWQGGGGVGVGHATPSRRTHIHRRNLVDKYYATMVSAAHDALMEYGFTQMGSVKPSSCFSPVVHCSRRHANITSALFSHSAALCLPLHPAPQSNRNGAMWHRRA